jgi:hypothetical protein
MNMKRTLLLSIIAALLGGCAVVPVGYGEHRDGYYRDRSYSRDGYYPRDSTYDQGNGYYRNRGYVGGWGDQGDPFRQHGG